MHDAVTSQAVIAGTLLTIVDKHLILVFGLEEAAHRSLRQSVLLNELIAVIALLEQDGCMVVSVLGIVLHLAVRIECLACPPTTHIDVASWQTRGLQEEMNHNVFGRRPVIVVVRAPHNINTVLVLRITVGIVYDGRKECGMIVRLEPFNAVHSCCRAMHIENLKAMVFVAGREDEVAIVCELDAIGSTDVRHKTLYPTVPTAVLHDDDFEVTLRVED